MVKSETQSSKVMNFKAKNIILWAFQQKDQIICKGEISGWPYSFQQYTSLENSGRINAQSSRKYSVKKML